MLFPASEGGRSYWLANAVLLAANESHYLVTTSSLMLPGCEFSFFYKVVGEVGTLYFGWS